MGFFDFLGKKAEPQKQPVSNQWRQLHRFQMSSFETSMLLTLVEQSQNSADDDEAEVDAYIRVICKQRNLALPYDFSWSLGGGNDCDWLGIDVRH